METIYLSQEDVLKLLDVSYDNLRQYKARGTLEQKLLCYGLKLINVIGKGKKAMYQCEGIETANVDTISKKHKVDKDKLSKHTLTRFDIIEKDLNKTKQQMSLENEISLYLIDKYDEILMVEEAIDIDGYNYFKLSNGISEKVEYEEYKSFWIKQTYFKTTMIALFNDYKAKRITIEKLLEMREYHMNLIASEGIIYIRIKKFKKGSRAEEIFNSITLGEKIS